MPKAFVTGATGFLGFNLVSLLRREGWDVVAIHPDSKTDALYALSCDLEKADITDPESLLASRVAGPSCKNFPRCVPPFTSTTRASRPSQAS